VFNICKTLKNIVRVKLLVTLHLVHYHGVMVMVAVKEYYSSLWNSSTTVRFKALLYNDIIVYADNTMGAEFTTFN